MNQVSEALKTQLGFLQQLQQILDNELHLISTRDAEALIKLVKEKESLLDEIQLQDQKIGALLTSATSTDDETESLKQEIFKWVEDCKYRTRINATAVEQGQLRLEHLRSLIMESRAKESLTYDKAGKKHAGQKGGGISA